MVELLENEPPPPPPLPRGNYGQNMHNFLSTQPSNAQEMPNGICENMDNIIDLTTSSKLDKNRNADVTNERKFRGQIASEEYLTNNGLHQISKSHANESQSSDLAFSNPITTPSSHISTTTNANLPKTNFVLGEYQRRKSKVSTIFH